MMIRHCKYMNYKIIKLKIRKDKEDLKRKYKVKFIKLFLTLK